MSVGTVMNPDVGILLRFSYGCEIKRKHIKHAINVDVLFEFRQTQSSLFYH